MSNHQKTKHQQDDPMTAGHPYSSLLLRSAQPPRHRLMLGIPMTGTVRSEWMLARYGQVIPTNWSQSEMIEWMNSASPLNYAVADARNACIQIAVEQNFEWLFFIDSDVILPPMCFVWINEYIRNGTIPVVNGLYFTKSHPPEPLIYRGRGNSYYSGWRMGDKKWVDGISMGCTLLSVKLLRAMWADAPEYVAGGNRKLRKVFETPYGQWVDPEAGMIRTYGGTEDLSWCDRVINGEYLKKAGFEKIGKKKYPFLSDTRIACLHIDPGGTVYPIGGMPPLGTVIR